MLQLHEDGSTRVNIPGPPDPGRLRHVAAALEALADRLESEHAPECPRHGGGDDRPAPDPVDTAAVLDDVRAVLMGRGRDHGWKSTVINIDSQEGGAAGIGVARLEDRVHVSVVLGSVEERRRIAQRSALASPAQVQALDYIQVIEFNEEVCGHLRRAIDTAWPPE